MRPADFILPGGTADPKYTNMVAMPDGTVVPVATVASRVTNPSPANLQADIANASYAFEAFEVTEWKDGDFVPNGKFTLTRFWTGVAPKVTGAQGFTQGTVDSQGVPVVSRDGGAWVPMFAPLAPVPIAAPAPVAAPTLAPVQPPQSAPRPVDPISAPGPGGSLDPGLMADEGPRPVASFTPLPSGGGIPWGGGAPAGIMAPGSAGDAGDSGGGTRTVVLVGLAAVAAVFLLKGRR